VLPDFLLEQSFTDCLQGAGQADSAAIAIAAWRLVQVVNLLNNDPTLKRLLAEVATIPFDLRLLWRRELMLVPYFERGVAAPQSGEGVLAEALAPRYELPFDLLLNDSVIVRLSATVVPPQGPSGAAGGIVMLRAQQAEDVSRQVRLQLLACKRGASSDWQRAGLHVRCGAVDEGVALAFSPDGRWVAMPGELGVVELRDLQSPDPTSTRSLCGSRAKVRDLAFLDTATLLVACGSAVEAFDLTVVGALDAKLAPVATVATPATVAALELAPQRACFVGLGDGAVQRWAFVGNLGTPQIEPVCDGDKVGVQMAIDSEPLEFMPPPGFLVSGDDRDRVVVGQGLWIAAESRGQTSVGTGSKDFEYVRDAAGVWHKRELSPLSPSATQRERWRGTNGIERGMAGVFKGGGFSETLRGDLKLFAGATVMLMGGTHGVKVLGDGHHSNGQIVHGFDPSGRFAAFVSPGYRLLIDCERAVALP
jgi:hypothetical protein